MHAYRIEVRSNWWFDVVAAAKKSFNLDSSSAIKENKRKARVFVSIQMKLGIGNETHLFPLPIATSFVPAMIYPAFCYHPMTRFQNGRARVFLCKIWFESIGIFNQSFSHNLLLMMHSLHWTINKHRNVLTRIGRVCDWVYELAARDTPSRVHFV